MNGSSKASPSTHCWSRTRRSIEAARRSSGPLVGDGVRVSVIICTYRRAGALTDLLRCLSPQNHRELEVLVVDGSGEDAAVRAAVEATARHWDSDIELRLIPSAKGLTRQRNVGIDAARGAWFALTHDPYLTHFLHRWWAWVAVAALVVMARRVKPLDRRASIAIHATIGTQVLLGIATVMSGMNIVIATLHQAVGAAVVIAFAWGAHVVGRQER